MVNVILPRNRVDAREAGPFAPARQNQVPDEARAPNLDSGKRHPHLECDAGLLRQHRDRASAPHLGEEPVEQLAHCGRFPLEVGFQVVTAARMRLVPVGEFAPASRATPHGPPASVGSRHAQVQGHPAKVTTGAGVCAATMTSTTGEVALKAG